MDLQEFVKTSFDTCRNDKEKASKKKFIKYLEIEKYLTKLIKKAQDSGKLIDIDWKKQKLPE